MKPDLRFGGAVLAALSVIILVTLLMTFTSHSSAAPVQEVYSPFFVSFCAKQDGTMAHNAAGAAGCELKSGVTIPQTE
jgi:hypothetical protein